MNNIDLMNMFEEILQVSNGFDRVIELKNREKEYKKSTFYKKTRMSIDKAYAIFLRESAINMVKRIRDLMNPEYLGIYLTETLEGISPESVQNLLDSFMSMLNIEDLIKNAQQLGEQIKTLK